MVKSYINAMCNPQSTGVCFTLLTYWSCWSHYKSPTKTRPCPGPCERRRVDALIAAGLFRPTSGPGRHGYQKNATVIPKLQLWPKLCQLCLYWTPCIECIIHYTPSCSELLLINGHNCGCQFLLELWMWNHQSCWKNKGLQAKISEECDVILYMNMWLMDVFMGKN